MSKSVCCGTWLVGLLTALLWAAPARATLLDDVASANSHMKRAEANLDLVDGAIGHLTSPPKGSAAKLAKMRLEQALGDLEAARKLLDGASGAGAAEAVERYNKDNKLYGKLRGILTGEGPPEDTPPDTPPDPKPDPKPETPPEPEERKTVKLGYPHADNFKNTLFTLRRVEADTKAIYGLFVQLKPVEDQLSIHHGQAASAMANIQETRRQAGFVATGLEAIPANGEGVAEAHERLAAARASLDAAHAYFEPLDARLRDLIDPANYPEYAQDLKRLRELAEPYSNPDYTFRDQRARAAEALAQRDDARAECLRIGRVYGRLMEQETEQGKQIEHAGNRFLAQLDAFSQAAVQQQGALPGEIREHLRECDQYAKEAVENQKPLWFTGGIPQRMEWVDDKLALYAVLDPAGSVAVAKEVDAMKASLEERADSLKELIIRENPLPADRFAGADREAAIAVAKDAWKIQEPNYELLAVRIPSEAWSRETKWTYNNGTWYFVDKSTLQVRLIVADKDNPAQAIDRPVNVRKDHQKGDTLIGVPMRSFDEALQPSEYLLRDKIK